MRSIQSYFRSNCIEQIFMDAISVVIVTFFLGLLIAQGVIAQRHAVAETQAVLMGGN